MNLMLAPLSKMMLARHLGTASVPTFEIAYNIAFRLRGLLESGFRAIMPEVSRLSATDTPEANTRIRSVQRRAEWLVFTAALPMFASVVVFCTPILHLWLRHRYRADIPTAVQILAVGAFLSLLGVPAYHVLLGAGQLKQVLTAHALQASTNGLLLAALMFLGRRTLSTDLVAFTTTCGFAVGGLYTFIASRRYAPKRHPLTTAALQKIGGAETPAEVATEAKAPGQMVTMKLHCEPLPSE
jgi:O-antigen/teichoic acid export membrane protein